MDILVEFEKNTPNLYEIETELKKYLKLKLEREIDVCAKKWINPIFKPMIMKEALYA